MTQKNKKRICRVCGLYYRNFYPWGEDGKIPSHEICDCCGIEFGYEDNNNKSTENARKKWTEGGYVWFNFEKRPKGWDSLQQLKNIPPEFLGPDEKY